MHGAHGGATDAADSLDVIAWSAEDAFHHAEALSQTSHGDTHERGRSCDFHLLCRANWRVSDPVHWKSHLDIGVTTRAQSDQRPQ